RGHVVLRAVGAQGASRVVLAVRPPRGLRLRGRTAAPGRPGDIVRVLAAVVVPHGRGPVTRAVLVQERAADRCHELRGRRVRSTVAVVTRSDRDLHSRVVEVRVIRGFPWVVGPWSLAAPTVGD